MEVVGLNSGLEGGESSRELDGSGEQTLQLDVSTVYFILNQDDIDSVAIYTDFTLMDLEAAHSLSPGSEAAF